MNNPVHKMKKRISYADNSKPPYWIDTDAHGWLATGVDDHGGDEIHEGDIVHFDEYGKDYVVNFYHGAFWLGNTAILLGSCSSKGLFIVGHVAEDES